MANEAKLAKEELEKEIKDKIQEFMDTYKVFVTDIRYYFRVKHSFSFDKVVVVAEDVKLKTRENV